ncbi:unnamed protein product [Closterium sp. NIES-54]
MAICPSSIAERPVLPSPPASSLPEIPDPEWGLARAASPTHTRCLATLVTDPMFEMALAALGFTPSNAGPLMFLCTNPSLPLFYILVYVNNLVFATTETEPLVLVNSYGKDTPALTWVLQRFRFQFSSPESTPLPMSHSLAAPPLDESVKPSGLYPEFVGYRMYLMTCTRPDLAYPLNIMAHYVVPRGNRPENYWAATRVLRYLCSILRTGLLLGVRGPVVLTGHSDASWVNDQATQRLSHGYTFDISTGFVLWRSTRSSSVLSSSCEAEICAGAMAGQELRWLTNLLTVLGEWPRSPPILYVDNKAMIALCREC